MKLSLYYPVRPFIVGQKFGETAYLDYYKNNGVIFAGHNGIDLGAVHGEAVRAAHDGIAYPEVDEKQGHGVVLITNDKFEYEGSEYNFKTIYWHLIDNIPVKWGQEVKAGDIIGYADSTGLSTGDHLHFGLKPVDKLNEAPNTWGNVYQNNGYQGAINPAPFFNGRYADEVSRFTFTRDLELNDANDDVRELQKKLQKLGYFPAAHDITNFYGPITRAAVFAFQQENIPNLSLAARLVYKGRYCSALTRNALNNI